LSKQTVFVGCSFGFFLPPKDAGIELLITNPGLNQCSSNKTITAVVSGTDQVVWSQAFGFGYGDVIIFDDTNSGKVVIHSNLLVTSPTFESYFVGLDLYTGEELYRQFVENLPAFFSAWSPVTNQLITVIQTVDQDNFLAGFTLNLENKAWT
jgi:hypothetical protein